MTIHKLKYSIFFLGIWIVSWSYLWVIDSSSIEYAATEEGARNLNKLSECSGGVHLYSQGYRCDGYMPNVLSTIIILIGALALILALISMFYSLKHRSK